MYEAKADVAMITSHLCVILIYHTLDNHTCINNEQNDYVIWPNYLAIMYLYELH